MDALDLVKDIGLSNEEPSKSRKTLRVLFTMASFLVLAMVLVYFLGDYGILDIFSGYLVSEQINEDLTFAYGGYTITFDDEVYGTLRSLYLANQQHEFKICLTGKKEGNSYLVDGYYLPLIHSQSVFEVVSSGCSDKTLVSMHSHPFKHCIFSSQDIKSYHHEQKYNPEMLLGLMCTLERFTFYRE